MFEERIVLDSAEFYLRHLTDSADDRQLIATFPALGLCLASWSGFSTTE